MWSKSVTALLAGLLLSLATTGCAQESPGTPSVGPGQAPSSPATRVPGDAPPIRHGDRNPIPERNNRLNEVPPVPNEVAAPEFDALRGGYLIPDDLFVARRGVYAAAAAFAGTLRFAVQEPQPSSLNLELPGHPSLVALPAQMNTIARAALYFRDGVAGVDVGPSFPDASGRVWVAVFQGAGGPIGNVQAVCFGVTLRSEGGKVVVELPEMPATLFVQPASARDIPQVTCEVDLQESPDRGFAPVS